MSRKAFITVIPFLVITVMLLFLPHQEYGVDVIEYCENGAEQYSVEYYPQSLADQITDWDIGALIFTAFLFPFVLIIEATFFPRIREDWNRLLFLVQAFLQAFLTFMVWFVMIFKLWNSIHLFVPYYLIIVYLGAGVLWNLLLALPYTDKIEFIAKSFEMLSLKKRKEHAG